MMGHRQVEQAALFYEFSLEKHVPADHLLRSRKRARASNHTALTKVGKKRRFRAPLSPAMVRSLCRARIAGRVMHDRQSREWVFPVLSRSGHVEEIKSS